MSTTQRRALVVGVQAYLDAGLAPRPGTCAALRAVAERLRAGGYHVALLVDDAAHDAERPLLANLLDRLGWLADGADAPLLVLSGHLEDGAFLPRDARRSLLGRTALSLDELVGLLPATAGVVIDGPTPAAPFAGLAWALGAGAAPPVTHGTRETRKQILIYTLLLSPVGMILAFSQIGGPVFFMMTLALNAMFITGAWRLYRRTEGMAKADAFQAERKFFRLSLLYLFAHFGGLLIEAGLRWAGLGLAGWPHLV